MERNAHASPLVLDTKDVGRRPGAMHEVDLRPGAPADFGTDVLAVPQDQTMDLRVRMESVHEGVLVTGTADATLKGECGRCLRPLHEGITVDLQELYLTGTSEDDAGEQPLVVRETVDLEPVFRDAVVIALPFQPLCRPDCEGLCADCGIRLEDAPEGHAHEPVDPRWAALAHLAGTSETSITETEER